MMTKWRWVVGAVMMFSVALAGRAFQFRGEVKVDSTHNVSVGGATIQVDFGEGPLDLGTEAVVGRVKDAAQALTVYYGKFPVTRDRMLIIPVPDRHGVFRGTTWGDRGGFPSFTRISVGQQTTAKELADDWMITHELAHTSFPNLAEEHHWMEEGLATYVESIARARAGQLTPERAWSDLVNGLAQGQPGPGDRGLDHTHTWGRTYWGGAIFCLKADVEIRRRTQNRKGLEHALRAIRAAGGVITENWSMERVISTGDKATGVPVLRELYDQMKATPVTTGLDGLYQQLGIHRKGREVTLDDAAPLGEIRKAITRPN